MISKGILEYLDVNEEDNSYIALYESDVIYRADEDKA